MLDNTIGLTSIHYQGDIPAMPLAQSKLTARGRISVPVEIRRKLRVGPGSILEWDEKNGDVIVRKAGRHTSVEVHLVLFADGSPKRKASASMKKGIGKFVRQKHARR